MHRLLAPTALLFAVACGGSAPKDAPAEPKAEAPKAEPAKKTCTYAVKSEGNAVTWTAFKFTERAGVGGAFDAVTVTPGKGGDAAWKALDGVAFSIDTASVNSKNPDRDAKIKAQFFGTLTETAAIKGTIKANSEGKATLALTMNGATHPVTVDVAEADGALTLKGKIDVETWEGGSAIAALNKVCEDLHKGADGVSKLWSEVDIAATVAVDKTCK